MLQPVAALRNNNTCWLDNNHPTIIWMETKGVLREVTNHFLDRMETILHSKITTPCTHPIISTIRFPSVIINHQIFIPSMPTTAQHPRVSYSKQTTPIQPTPHPHRLLRASSIVLRNPFNLPPCIPTTTHNRMKRKMMIHQTVVTERETMKPVLWMATLPPNTLLAIPPHPPTERTNKDQPTMWLREETLLK